ncbi:tubulin delta chain-like [Elgaria multicarinata webbii]|uniref:tubulin delta chain-like n=1 Tax=Elgaria multicarinata webbii TaxID=159646 RepID=UPI002FCD227F
MSAVWLQIGQCGNQIGQEWWQMITSAKNREGDMYPFYSQDDKLSVVCVDSEPKVVRRLQKQIKRRVFRESNLIVGKQGRGNNWAYGYHGVRSESEQNLFRRTMESLRKEVERKDSYCGTVLFHSLSGGTGAGLSSRLCEALREEYPLGYILAVSVAPHQAGESPLQHYNSLLCLSWLQRYADGILLFHNDEVLKRAATLQGKDLPEASSQVSLSAMNTYVASCLAGLLHPLKIFTTRSGISLGTEPWELLRSVCPMPTLKFLHTAQASSRGTVFWDSLASSVVQPLPRECPAGSPHRSTALLAVARSPQEDAFLLNHSSVLTKLKRAYRCVPWNPFSAKYWTDAASLATPGLHDHTLTVCANHSSSADFLQRVEQRARAMYKSNAFLHWYWRHGCEEGDFGHAFEALRSVVEVYSRLGD